MKRRTIVGLFVLFQLTIETLKACTSTPTVSKTDYDKLKASYDQEIQENQILAQENLGLGRIRQEVTEKEQAIASLKQQLEEAKQNRTVETPPLPPPSATPSPTIILKEGDIPKGSEEVFNSLKKRSKFYLVPNKDLYWEIQGTRFVFNGCSPEYCLATIKNVSGTSNIRLKKVNLQNRYQSSGNNYPEISDIRPAKDYGGQTVSWKKGDVIYSYWPSQEFSKWGDYKTFTLTIEGANGSTSFKRTVDFRVD